MDFNHQSACVATCQFTHVHVFNQPCVTPTNTQISLMLLSNTQVDFADLWQLKNLLWNILISIRQIQVLESGERFKRKCVPGFDTAHNDKGIQTFSPNRTNSYQLPIHSVSIPSETVKSIKSWSDLETRSCTHTWLYSLEVHYCRSVVVIRNKLCEGPKHLNTMMRTLDEE